VIYIDPEPGVANELGLYRLFRAGGSWDRRRLYRYPVRQRLRLLVRHRRLYRARRLEVLKVVDHLPQRPPVFLGGQLAADDAIVGGHGRLRPYDDRKLATRSLI